MKGEFTPAERAVIAKLSRKGGLSRSKKKREASSRNLALARASIKKAASGRKTKKA